MKLKNLIKMLQHGMKHMVMLLQKFVEKISIEYIGDEFVIRQLMLNEKNIKQI